MNALKWKESRSPYHRCWHSTHEEWEGFWPRQCRTNVGDIACGSWHSYCPWRHRPLTQLQNRRKSSRALGTGQRGPFEPHWRCLQWRMGQCFEQHTLCCSRVLFLWVLTQKLMYAKLLLCYPCHGCQGFLLEVPVSLLLCHNNVFVK